jgi:hypothetical protein
MTYGLHHPVGFPTRSLGLGGRSLRTLRGAVRRAVAVILSRVLPGLVAYAILAITANILFASAATIGAMERGESPLASTVLISCAATIALLAAYRALRGRTPPRVELPSGRSSPLYDRELDG